MKGFIEVVNQIKDTCEKSEQCIYCPFNEIAADEQWCYFALEPGREWDPLEIMRRLQAHD